jgi:hypothetical protein
MTGLAAAGVLAALSASAWARPSLSPGHSAAAGTTKATPSSGHAAGRQPPYAALVLSSSILSRGGSVLVSGRGSRLAQGDRILGASVQFGDGSRPVRILSLSQGVRHMYLHAGVFTIRLVVRDVRGRAAQARRRIAVLGPRGVTARHGTVIVASDQVISWLAVPALPDQVRVLKRGAPVPRRGAALVVLPGAAMPEGFLGEVNGASKNSDRTSTVTAVPRSLDAAYSRFSVAVARDVAALNPTLVAGASASDGRSHARRARVSSLPFTCKADGGYSVAASADLSKTHVDASLDIRSRAIHFLFAFYPSFTLDAKLSGSATCTLANAGALQLTIPVAAPLTLTVRPEFKLDASGSIEAQTTWTPRMVIGFDRAPGISDNPIAFGSGISFSAKGNAEANLYAGLSIALGVGGQLGVTGSAGPDLDAKASLTSNGSSATACAHVDGFVKAELSANADVFVKHWSWTLFSGDFFRTTLYDHCTTTTAPPGGGGGAPEAGGGAGGGAPGGTVGPPPPSPPPQAPGPSTFAETAGGVTHTWTNYTNAGGYQGASIPSNATVQVSCRIVGFRVADGDTWWYRVASSPWNNAYYASADAFYNNGQTSGSLKGTPFVDEAVPGC